MEDKKNRIDKSGLFYQTQILQKPVAEPHSERRRHLKFFEQCPCYVDFIDISVETEIECKFQ